jgi:hypothetical protein
LLEVGVVAAAKVVAAAVGDIELPQAHLAVALLLKPHLLLMLEPPTQ